MSVRHPDQQTTPEIFGRLGKTRNRLGRGLGDLLLGERQLSDELFEEIENLLLGADIGLETTRALLDEILERTQRKELADGKAVYAHLRQAILNILSPCARPLQLAPSESPIVIMVVGVNGVGKTTTCGKLAQCLKKSGLKVMLAAADTFRAAAVEQLQVWGQQLDIPVIAQESGADAGAVAHDALDAAQARNIDVLIVDTAGRQHTHRGLMDELKKVKRVLQNQDREAPHEIMLVLDAGTGQNALSQLTHFDDAVAITGITLTKLDGTAKGGILVAIARQGTQPIRFIGIGEKAEDLLEFDADAFVDALLQTDR